MSECVHGWIELGLTESEAKFRCQLGRFPPKVPDPITESRLNELGISGRGTFIHGEPMREQLDEILPLLIIVAQKKPEIKEFYKNLMDFTAKLARSGQSSWVGQWMSHKLTCMVMERFGLIWHGGAASYDAGLSWAFAVVAATEFLSDIQVSDIVENIYNRPIEVEMDTELKKKK